MARVNSDLTSPDGNVRTGWRHMLRDRGGTVIAPGGNVIHALDALCEYEDVCEAAGIHGPEELLQILERACACGVAGAHRKTKTTENAKWNALYSGKTNVCHCEDCAAFQPAGRGARRGTCAKFKRKIRPNGGKGQSYVELQEQRPVTARRVACKSWEPKAQWIGPSAELQPEY